MEADSEVPLEAAALRRARRGEALKMPNVVRLLDLLDSRVSMEVGGRWIPARPLPYYSWRARWRAAWLVFTGRADALVWPETKDASAKGKARRG